jgi:hypothetical protein
MREIRWGGPSLFAACHREPDADGKKRPSAPPTRLTVLLAAAVLAQAQPAGSLVHVAGFVVDLSGNPVQGAAIVYAGRTIPTTDADGKFEVDTSAPAFVVRKQGFRSEFVRINSANVPRITIQERKETLTFPTCSEGGLIGIKGFQSEFHFRKVRGVVAGRQGGDVDFGQRFYYVETRQGRKGISHGSGVHWGSGLPMDEDVWRSQKYDETVYTVGNETILDARGEFANGGRWRRLDRAGETAGYSDVDEATARILDRFLNGACLRPAR